MIPSFKSEFSLFGAVFVSVAPSFVGSKTVSPKWS